MRLAPACAQIHLRGMRDMKDVGALTGVRIIRHSLPPIDGWKKGYHTLELIVPDDGSFGDNRHALDKILTDYGRRTFDVVFRESAPKPPVWGSCVSRADGCTEKAR